MKDWTGNSKSVYSTLGASNHVDETRQPEDFYAPDPVALEKLLEHEKFCPYVWECACGEGHLSRVLMDKGYDVRNTDIVDRGFPNTEVADFLKITKEDADKDFSRDIVTNPPYKLAKEFVEHACEISMDSVKIAMLLKIQFLEGQARQELFKKHPPKCIYVFSKRVACAKNGDFGSVRGSAVAYAWFVWERGYKGDPRIKWI